MGLRVIYEKAEEVDDSSGYFGAFGGSLFSRWVIARQAACADPAGTVARLLAWMAHDQYGFWSNVEKDIASALNEVGQAACIARIEHLLGSGARSLPNPAYARRQLDKLLRAVYVAQRDAGAYITLAEQSGLTAKDCHAVATIFAAKGERTEALSWAERGLDIDGAEPHGSFAGYDLRELRRALLIELGCHEEAVQAAWPDFVRTPSVYGYNALMELVPAPERAAWHQRQSIRPFNTTAARFRRWSRSWLRRRKPRASPSWPTGAPMTSWGGQATTCSRRQKPSRRVIRGKPPGCGARWA